MTLDNCVNTLVADFHTEVLDQDKTQDARKDTDTHHFGSYGRTHAQGYRNFADCDPLVLINASDHDSTTTSTVNLGAAIPQVSHRLPFFGITHFVHNKCSLSFHTQVRPVISFLIVCPEDVLHVNVDLERGHLTFLFRHECNIF